MDAIISCVYGDFQDPRNREDATLIGRCIFCPKNAHAHEVNTAALRAFPGDMRSYHSIDTVTDEEEAGTYATELLNTLTPSGFPPHMLEQCWLR